MAQLISVRLHKSDHQPLGFRLQGGKDFGTPLVIQKVNGGSSAEAAGLQAGDAVIRVNATDVYNLRHQEAQDAIRASGGSLELTVQRGGGTWRPSVTPVGSLPRPSKVGGALSPVTKTSLKASPQPSLAFGSGHNSVAKPFNYMNGSGDTVKSIVNKQYNTPVNMYSDQSIAETLSAQTEVLAGGVLGVNFKKNEKSYDAEKSAVFKMLQEDTNDPEPEVNQSPIAPPISGLRHVPAPMARPEAPINNTGGLPPGQNICEECERLIIGVFVRIKDKNLHVECFKCATCGTSLKNQGYYNLNGKLYCDIHAKLVARNNPPAPNLEPVTVPPGSKFPSGTYSAPLSAHTTPLPPLATNSYSNGSSSLFSPASNLSGPKPFGSTGSAYSPSLSPRSAPISPAARPLPTHQHHLAPAHISAPAPAPISAPTSDSHTNTVKPEFNSAAEERLIRKMAKMALNGYEIGIQRRIKPNDYLQSMANKIQDTIVTKHPLNSESSSEDDRIGARPLMINGKISPERMCDGNQILANKINGNENVRKIKQNENILNIGDKIKDTIVNKHPSHKYASSLNHDNVEVNKEDNLSTIGDKIKETIVNKHPTNVYSNNNDNNSKEQKLTLTNADVGKHSYDNDTEMELQKYLQDPDQRAKFMSTVLNSSKAEDITDYPDEKSQTKQSNYISSHKNGLLNNTLPKAYQQDSNVKATILAMEKNDSLKEDLHQNSANNTSKYSTNFKNNFTNTLKKTSPKYTENTLINSLKEKQPFGKINDNNKSDLTNTVISAHHSLPTISFGKDNDLYENRLYTIKNRGMNGQSHNLLETMESEKHKSFNGGKKYDDERSSSEELKESSLTSDKVTDSNIDGVVKMRKKKRDTALDGGKRDSHIIARPLSTMESQDCGDGMYPVCHIDDKAITRGPFITALGRIWCPDHFVCVNASCRRPLQDIGFVEENGQLYCEYCFEQFIAPACNKCHAKIKGDCLNAIGKHFHPECFNCVYCGKLFGNNPFFLEDGLPYCEADWNELFTTKCFACGFPVEAGDRWVEALNNNYHSQCFNCTMCKKNLEGQSFFAKGGRPFCKNHAR